MRSLLREFAFIAVLTVLGAAGSVAFGVAPLPWKAPELEPGEIRPVDARRMDAVWIDARDGEAYETGHVPGAIHLNEEVWEAGIFRLMDQWRGEPIIVYCDSAACGTSRRIAERLREELAGEVEVYTLHGGWDAWNR